MDRGRHGRGKGASRGTVVLRPASPGPAPNDRNSSRSRSSALEPLGPHDVQGGGSTVDADNTASDDDAGDGDVGDAAAAAAAERVPLATIPRARSAVQRGTPSVSQPSTLRPRRRARACSAAVAVASTSVLVVLATLLSIIVFQQTHPSVFGSVSSVLDTRLPPTQVPGLERIIGVDSSTNMLVDQYGRTRLFRGVNVVYKAPPWHPATDRFDASTSFVEKDAEILAQLGINAIRLAIHWAGAEPERGSFNQTYFDVMRTIIRTCARHGIYVLLEFHQDVLAQQFCGHGLPSWMIKSDWVSSWKRFPVPQHLRPFGSADPSGIPSPEQCRQLVWFGSYFTFAVGDAFQRLYANHDGMLDRFAEYWMRVATEYKDEPNLLGYEIMNEPWPGNHWRNPFLLLPGIASQTTLFNMHKRVAAAIRSVDPQAIIYFEGATWDIHNRAPTVPGGPNYANRSVLSYHYYRPPAIGSVRDTFRRRQQDAQRLGSGLFMTEFEMWWGPGNASETGALARMRETVEAADEYLQNWMGWSYKSFAQAPNSTDASLFDEATGEQRPEMARLLSRPFVSAAQGNISAMRFDEAAGVFSVTLDRREPPAGSGGDGGGSGGAVADLEISTARSTWFGGGLRVSVEPRGRSSWSFDALRQRVSVRAQAGVRRVNVTVSAA